MFKTYIFNNLFTNRTIISFIILINEIFIIYLFTNFTKKKMIIIIILKKNLISI